MSRRLVPASAVAGLWLVLAYRAYLLSRTAGVTALVVFALFVLRIALAWRDAPKGGATPTRDVAVVLPVYNEDPELLRRCLESLTHQSHLPSRVWVVDDGSEDTAAIELAAAFPAPFPIHALRCAENRGKRAVQAEAFRRDHLAEVFVTSDSDTTFHRDAIVEGLRGFGAADVTAVAGVVRPLNRTRNLLTRIQDAEYLASFLIDRASLSSLRGSILVTSGGLAFYRADVVREVLEEYLAQSFAGRPVHTGDDRMLTQLCLQRGRVLLQHTAVAETAVPERLAHLVRQRVRWSRSFWVNSLWVLTHMDGRGLPFWITIYHLTSVLALALVVSSLVVASPLAAAWFVGVYLASGVVFGYLRAARLLAVALPGDTPGRQLATYLAVGPAVLFNLLVLVPVRYWALIRVRDVARWGTRDQVEVSVSALASAIFTAKVRVAPLASATTSSRVPPGVAVPAEATAATLPASRLAVDGGVGRPRRSGPNSATLGRRAAARRLDRHYGVRR